MCIRQLRRALDDAATRPRFIQTVPRRGYRFIAPVTPRSMPTPEDACVRPRGRAFIAVIRVAAVLALVAGAAVMGSYVAVRAGASAATSEGRIADAHAARGFVALNDDWDWTVAERAFTRALQLDPRHEVALISLSRLHAARGRFGPAVAFAQRAADAHPASSRARATLGWALLFSGDAHAAAAQCEVAQTRAPDSSAARQCRLNAAAELGTADLHVWDRALARLQSTAGPGTWFLRATLEARAGHAREALASLTRALAEREPDASFALVHPAFSPLRQDPAFLHVTRAAGLSRVPW